MIVNDAEALKQPYSTEAARWDAVEDRDSAADGCFVYAVSTTGVYCRPGCSARLAKREHVSFFDTCEAAEGAGFRPCRRCRPDEAGLRARHGEAVARACRMIEASDTSLSLGAVAAAVGMSPHHFHRVFKAETGVTPRAYGAAWRAKRVRDGLSGAGSITEAIYNAGFNANSRFYESSKEMLGMSPTEFRAGGKGTAIRFAVGECWLGPILVAATEKGICAIFLGDDPAQLARDLQDAFPHADIMGDDASFEALVAQVVGFVEQPSRGLALPLDIRGTAFQCRVWEALRAVPPGMTASYTEIAREIGEPKAVRAVASACGANRIAVAIPCHRIVRTDGALSGYRWGIARKGALLAREQERR